MTEPTVIYATVRDSGDDDWWDIECRFSDGQKFAAIQVAHEFEQLAHKVADAVTAKAPNQ